MNAFEILHITKNFGETEVLRDISLALKTGEFLALLGPSGCGKTTLLSIIAGLVEADCGSVVKTGRPAIMMQKDLLLPWKKVIDNIALPIELAGIGKRDARAKASPYLKDFGLAGFEYGYPRKLSGGMRQRAALLRTWLSGKDIMLLDEPLGSLDALTRRTMQEWLAEIRRLYGMTILMVTHDVEEAVFLADRVIVLSSRPARIVEEIDMEKQRLGVTSSAESEKQKSRILKLLLANGENGHKISDS